MSDASQGALVDRFVRVPPFTELPADLRDVVAAELSLRRVEDADVIFARGDPLAGLFLIVSGSVDIRAGEGEVISHRGPGELMGERGLLRDGRAMLTAHAAGPTELIVLPAARFHDLLARVPAIAEWFSHARPIRETPEESPLAVGLMAVEVRDVMTPDPETCAPECSVREVARRMRARRIGSVLVREGTRLVGIVTLHDLVNKVLAEGLSPDLPVARVMTPDPVTIGQGALGLDALMEMSGRGINHLPVTDAKGALVGMIGRTDLFRQQAATASHMAAEIAAAPDSAHMAGVMQRLPDLLTALVSAGLRPSAICRRITDLTDAVTRRLVQLALDEFGPAPAPWVWAACGSQGRREQTGVSDQDNCLILSDEARPDHDAWFERFARFVSDGLNAAGFVYCPGDMMATNPRWRQPRRVWRRYFDGWIDQPDQEAQMLASVMFDLRAIAGSAGLLHDLRRDTLERARGNSIFVRHMIGNSLKHAPPLSLFRGLSVIRSGAHRNTIDLKHAGVVPVVDLGRVYALKGGLAQVGTLERIRAAGEAGVISAPGARDLEDAFNLIAATRLRHQAAQIARGERPDNFLAPDSLSDMERNHLRDAFLVVRTMQSALGSP